MPHKLNINGRELVVEAASNVLDACLKAGVEVPHYCWHPGLSVVASCRLCLVEAGATDPKDAAKIAWQPKLVPACQTPLAREGVTYVKTDTEKVKSNQRHVMEYLLINHPLDCPVCDQAGECLLQDFSFKYGNSKSRFVENKEKQPKKDLGPTIMLFADRCIMCSRCVRFEQEISGAGSLAIVNRGNKCEIDIFPGSPLDNKMSGNVGDICPVGALEDKDFLYQQRVWFLRDHPSVCAGCSTGCSTWVDVNPTTQTQWRLRPRTNLQVNQYWMCDEGRYGWKHVHSPNRLVGPVLRGALSAAASAGAAKASAGHSAAVGPASQAGHSSTTSTAVLAPPAAPATPDWNAVYQVFSDAVVESLTKHGPAAAGAVISPFASNEEAFLLAKLVRSMGPEARLYLGPVPVAGQEEKFKSGFTIRPEKCPNRKGVQAVLDGLGGGAGFDQCRKDLSAGAIKTLIVLGGYSDSKHLDEHADALRKAELLVVIDTLAGRLTDAADVLMAAAAFVEREGSVVNFAGVCQRFDWALNPPGQARRTGQILADLSGRTGLYNSAGVLAEMAGEIPAFAEAAGGRLPAEGVKLSKL